MEKKSYFLLYLRIFITSGDGRFKLTIIRLKLALSIERRAHFNRQNSWKAGTCPAKEG